MRRLLTLGLLPFVPLFALAASHQPEREPRARSSASGAIALLSTSLATLKARHGGCDGAASLGKLACGVAIENECRSRGYLSGHGPLWTREGRIGISCLKEGEATRLTVRLGDTKTPQTLTACTEGKLSESGCKSAVHRLCESRGYLTGFGPTQWGKGEAHVLCFAGERASLVDFHDERLVTLGLALDFAGSPAEAQEIAAHLTCVDEGFVTGFGIVEVDASRGHGKVACLGPRKAAAEPKMERLWKALDEAGKLPNGGTSPIRCEGCGVNATRFTRPLGNGIAFGRHANTSAGDVFSLGLYHWSEKDGKPTIAYSKRLIDTTKGGAEIDGGKALIYNAYDPSAILFQGTTWVAFECWGKGTGLTAGICVGKLENGELNPRDAYVLVHTSDTPGEHMYSASVPKLVKHQGRLYLYWSQQKLVKGPYPQKLVSIQTKGVELFPGRDGRLGGPGGKPYHSNDGVTVAEGIDSFDVVSDGARLYMLGGSVPAGCETPLSPVAGCYDLTALRTSEPLAPNGFLAERKKVFPWNQSHEYATFFFGADGRRSGFFAQYLKSPANPGKLEGMGLLDLSR